jgi:hypothetical protein
MKLSEKLHKYLEVQPLARERKSKNRAIGNLLIETYDLALSKESMEIVVKDILSLDRSWRKILEENPELRGKDYGEKDELEHRKLKELGY